MRRGMIFFSRVVSMHEARFILFMICMEEL
jgi:hypothetical protein